MNRIASVLFAALTLCTVRAEACSCSGQGPASALTRPDQKWGLRLSERLVLGQGAFNAHGRYQAFAPNERDRSQEFALLFAYRSERMELSAVGGYGARSVALSTSAERNAGFADTLLRMRYEAAEEPSPWESSVFPSLAMLATLRLPSASAEGLAPRGLGTTEFALGVSLERSFGPKLRAGLWAEFAGRLPDTTFGYARVLGPRASAEGTLSYFATPDLVLSALISTRWEGNVRVQQRYLSGTAQRLTEIGAVISFQPWASPLRAGFAQRYTPPIDNLSANVLAAFSSEFWIGYVR
ncbi:MAG TPA: hypothetical protein VER11_22955 [Polyangiaceae bacterium]|nr:hypothetical protein [Polyangiaceae bacterium]